MAVTRYVLDTNILSALIKKEAVVFQHASTALLNNAEFLLCPVVFYEAYRGFLHRDAHRQLAFFQKLINTFTWDEFDRADWEQAAQMWANLQRQGQPLPDADLLIGTYAMRRDAIIVTDNSRHFARLGAPLENWRRE